jgi:lipid II:glycine glycyltransferase (peptidoglycan interpeptide bridge formation enzyme)
MSKLLTPSGIEHGQPVLTVTLNPTPETGELAAWDELVGTVPGSDVSQLSAWADVRRVAGFEPLYLFVRRGDELIGGALVLQRWVPVLGMVGYVPYGPLISPEVDGESLCAVLAVAMRRLARRTTRVLFIQPPLDGDHLSGELQRLGFRPSRAGIAPTASLRLDLAQDEEMLRAGLRKRLRTWSRSWTKRGVQVRRGTQGDLVLFGRLHAASAQHQGFEPLPSDYVATLYSRLAADGHAELFIGEVDGTAVAARLYTGCGGVLKQRLIGMDRDSAAARLNVPAAVEWEAIRWAKANGYQWFDFGGIREAAVSMIENQRSDVSQLTSSEVFKNSFGGTPYRYPKPVELISSRVVRSGYDLAMRWPGGRRAVKHAAILLRSGGLGGRAK